MAIQDVKATIEDIYTVIDNSRYRPNTKINLKKIYNYINKNQVFGAPEIS
ncbi:MAG: hypothetical protein RR444_02150 [Oscillospiraceae bacterium]